MPGACHWTLAFVQLGNLLEAEGTILPPPRTATVLAGAFQAGGTFGERDFISSWVLVESRAWSQVLEDFAVLLPLSWRRFGARRAAAGLTAPGALPVDPKAALPGCIAKGNRCREPAGEKLGVPASAVVPGSSVTHGRCCWRSCGAPGCWPTGAGGVGLVARVVWDRGGCRAWLVGTSAWLWPSSSGMEWYPELGEGWIWYNSCSPGRYWNPRWVLKWTLITAVCRLLCGGDIPLLTCVILDGGKIASEFCHSCSEGSGSSSAPQSCGVALLRAGQHQAASASPSP